MNTQCKIYQGFGENANSAYIQSGLKGHPAIDNSCGYGSEIKSYWDKEYVYKVLDKDHPANDGSGFTGVFTIVEQGDKVFEFLYGHCDPKVKVGDTITKGTIIGTEANNGLIYSGGVQITYEMQKNGDHRGAHRHDQARRLRKDKVQQEGVVYLTYEKGFFIKDGYMYAIPDYYNGFRGCFDWTKEDFGGNVGNMEVLLTPFMRMQEAILAFQLSENINDFKGTTDLRKVRFGNKTLNASKKYYI